MRFGLVCFGLLFMGIEFYQWVAHLTWLGDLDLSLPMTLVGGVGLAIASNYKSRSARLGSTVEPVIHPPAEPPPTVTPQPAPPSMTTAVADKSSISFKVRKPYRP
jgi:hypothetical protein